MKRIFWLVVIVAAVVGAAYGISLLTANEQEATAEQTIVIDEVGRATLQDTVIIRGQVGRDSRFAVVATTPQLVTAVGTEVDRTVQPGQELLRLDGRPMIAISGTVPYWRPLDRFSTDGPDVEMLEQFLADAGYSPGTINQDFTATTRDALEDWQEDNGYPVDGRFLPTDLAVQEWPARVGDVHVEVGDPVAAGQPLISLVENDLAVAVQVDPTDRSRLTIGLPAVITVTATDLESPGTVVDLADAPNLDGQGVERYEGEVAIDGTLNLVEGAAVRVEVILAEVVDALVVPVASVSLDGSGNEEVRILGPDGTIERVRVVTGLTEGALVEITEGLDGSEQVVVEVRS